MKRGTALVVAAAFVVASCTAGEPVTAADIELAEWVVDASDRLLQSGTVELRITNAGEFAHTLVVTDIADRVIATTDIIIPDGELGLSVPLEAGDYRFTCRIVTTTPDGTVSDHYERGMTLDVTVVN